jgi:CHAT domain-containing protein/Flp pilus assembly protein TadD
MFRVVGRHAVRIAVVTAMLVFAWGGPAASADDLVALKQQMIELHGQGRYQEAVAIGEKALALAERTLDADNGDALTIVNNLGFLYQQQGRYSEAERLIQRAVAGRERISGADHPETLTALSNLAALYDIQGRYAEAEPLYRRVLGGFERTRGPDHPDTLRSVNNLAFLFGEQARYAEAEPLYQRALAGREKLSGPDHPDTLAVASNIGMLYQSQGRFGEAEPLLKRVLSGNERALGPQHPDTLRSLNNLGLLYDRQGRDSEAEPLYQRALDGYERTLGPGHPQTLASVSNLGLLYQSQGRHGEAEPLLKRALTGTEHILGPDHPETLERVNNLGMLHQDLGRYADAEPLLKRALAGMEGARGPEHPTTLLTLNNLAGLYLDQSRYQEAEPLYLRALAGRERTLGPEHPQTFDAVNNLAMLYRWQNRFGEAATLFERAMTGYERVLGPDHPDTLRAVDNLATVHFEQSDWPRAVTLWRRSTAAVIRRTQRGAQTAIQPLTGKKKNDVEQRSWQFWGLIKAAYRLGPDRKAPDLATQREMFQMAQWASSSEVAGSLAQMAARGASGDVALAQLVRERQDLVADWQKRELARNAALGAETGKRDNKAEAENNERMAVIDRRIAAIDKRLAEGFPNYATLVSPAALTVEEVQALLGANEALVLFLDMTSRFPTTDETFIWFVTKSDMRSIRYAFGTPELAREVQALRCGLDYTAWTDPRCKELTGSDYMQADQAAGKALPFDHRRAYRLYKALFGAFGDLIKDKNLLLVPSGPLTQLPFHVLVTTPPAYGHLKGATWLARSHGVSVLPAVSSLKALRATGRPSTASKPLIGFGNPLLDGPDARFAKLAQRAREKQSCPKTPWQRIAPLFKSDSGAPALDPRAAAVNVSLIRRQTPLPETADELCAVARDLGADASEMRLGAKATEREVKAMSARGDLAKYRVVHFATHGAIAGQINRGSEPGLILTPPAVASEEDDGYLSASEIAALKLDADWVILSACNTATGNAENAEALSGLARAFIYAQARALLVSHWEVNSDAAVKLVTSAMRESANDKSVGRAEGLRRAMLALIDNGDLVESHPAFWAPFVVVGDGGGGR